VFLKEHRTACRRLAAFFNEKSINEVGVGPPKGGNEKSETALSCEFASRLYIARKCRLLCK
jgi:hypothetical protein